ncbi:MAG: inositol monophosphatase family protein [Myxococcota bacterium]
MRKVEPLSEQGTAELAEPLREIQRFALALLQEAGAMALRMQRTLSWDRKPDRTFVTNADLAVQSLIRERILAHYPQHLVLGEEDTEGVEKAASRGYPGVWIVDPIDGTDSYLRQIPAWAICLGLALEDQPTFGAVYLPDSHELFYAFVGGKAYRNGHEIHIEPSEGIGEDSMLLLTSTAHRYAEVDFPGRVRSYGCTAAHLCYVASGKVDAALIAGVQVWDLFAAGLVLRAAGGDMYQVSGEPIDLMELVRSGERTSVLIAGRSNVVQPVLGQVRPRRRKASPSTG